MSSIVMNIDRCLGGRYGLQEIAQHRIIPTVLPVAKYFEDDRGSFIEKYLVKLDSPSSENLGKITNKGDIEQTAQKIQQELNAWFESVSAPYTCIGTYVGRVSCMGGIEIYIRC